MREQFPRTYWVVDDQNSPREDLAGCNGRRDDDVAGLDSGFHGAGQDYLGLPSEERGDQRERCQGRDDDNRREAERTDDSSKRRPGACADSRALARSTSRAAMSPAPRLGGAHGWFIGGQAQGLKSVAEMLRNAHPNRLSPGK